jgi:hypothetical protein
VVEYPTVLEARLLGRSKMKVVKNVFRHLGQLSRFALLRLRTPRARAVVTEPLGKTRVTLERPPTS